MHWPPFLKAAVDYIHETYPDPESNPRARALISFIFAVCGHQLQDAAWHSIGLLMGLIDEVAQVDFKGDYGAAHHTLDWGGDAILGKRYSGHTSSSDWAYACLICTTIADCRVFGMFLSMTLPRFMNASVRRYQLGK